MKLFVTILLAAGVCSSLLASSSLSTGSSSRQRIVQLAEEGKQALANRQSEKAWQLFTQALDLAKPSNDYLAAAALHSLRGEVRETEGRYQEALAQYEDGIRVLHEKRTRGAAASDSVAPFRPDLGTKSFVSSSGEAVSADLYHGEIKNLASLLGQKKSQAHDELFVLLRMNAGNMYLQQKQFRQADTLYVRALQKARQSHAQLQQQKLFANLAWSALKTNRFEQAEVWLDSVLVDAAPDSIAFELRRAVLAVGVNWRERRNYPEALANLQRALPLYEAAGDGRGYARALAHLATTYFASDSVAKAVTLYREALQRNADGQDIEVNWHANGGLAKCYRRLGEDEQALEYYKNYLKAVRRLGESYSTDQGKVSILEDHDKTFREYAQVAINLAEKNGRFDLAREAIENIRSQTMGLSQVAQKNPGHMDAGYFLFRENWPVMQMEYGIGVRSLDVQQRALGVPSLEVMNKMAAGVPSLSSTSRLDTLSQTHLPLPKATFLEYFLFDDRAAILVKSPDGAINGKIVNITADSLATVISSYVSALEVQERRGLTVSRNITPASEPTSPRRPEREVAQELYHLLIAPVQKFLPANSAEPVVIVPHRALWQLPFAALCDERNNYLADQHVLTYAASEASWQLIARQPRSSDHRNMRAWVVGNPRMPQSAQACDITFSLSALPGAQEEAEAIVKKLGAKRAELFTGKNADRLRLEAWHSDFTVLHLATHGYACNEAPLNSFIALSALDSSEMKFDRAAARVALRHDARFAVTLDSMQQIAARPFLANAPLQPYPGLLNAWRIAEQFRLKADLVVLSACQTGLGQLLTGGEGMIGFSRTFLAAGARSVLVSLWRVDDQATKKLMIAFYDEYLRHGNKGLAFQKAMQLTRKQYPQPKYWAAFNLFGMAE